MKERKFLNLKAKHGSLLEVFNFADQEGTVSFDFVDLVVEDRRRKWISSRPMNEVDLALLQGMATGFYLAYHANSVIAARTIEFMKKMGRK